MRARRYEWVLLLVCLMLSSWAGIGRSWCGRSMPPPLSPTIQPSPLTAGCFQVHNTQTGLPTNHIRALYARGGKVLVGTEDAGLLISDGSGFANFHQGSNPTFPASTVHCLIDGEFPDELLAGTSAGVVRIDLKVPGKPRFELIPGSARMSSAILSLSRGPNLWLVGTDGQAGCGLGQDFTPFMHPEDRIPTGFASSIWFGERLFFGSSDGLYETTGHQLSPVSYGSPEFGWVNGLASLGRDLIVADSGGLYRIEPTGKVEELLPKIWATAVCVTPGVSALSRRNPKAGFELPADLLEKMDTMDPQVKALANKIVEANALLQSRSIALLQQYGNSNNIPNDLYFALWKDYSDMAGLEDQAQELASALRIPLPKGLWAGTQDSGALLFTDNGRIHHLNTDNSKIPSNRVTCIASKEDGETWIGTWDAGLLRFMQLTVPSGNKQQKLWSGKPTILRSLGNSIYLGTEKDGLVIFDAISGNQIEEVNDNRVRGFHKRVNDADLDLSARIWISGDEGVWCREDKGWRRFTQKQGLPGKDVRCFDVDRDSRLVLAGGEASQLSGQVAMHDGETFFTYQMTLIQNLLQLPKHSLTKALKAVGLTGTYHGGFDVARATEALLLFDKSPAPGRVTTLLGTHNFLLMGTDAGGLFFFNGEGFFPLVPATKDVSGQIVGMQRLEGDVVAIATEKQVRTFDTSTWTEFPPLPVMQARITSMTTDPRNQGVFWVSYRTMSDGGTAVFQNGMWQAFPFAEPVLGLAISEPFLYFVTPEGLYRIPLS